MEVWASFDFFFFLICQEVDDDYLYNKSCKRREDDKL